jgi:hypothetical protein
LHRLTIKKIIEKNERLEKAKCFNKTYEVIYTSGCLAT